jgi:uncharacterized protein (TIGR00369 family)
MSIKPDLLARLRDRFHNHPIQQHLQFEIVDLELDRCIMSLQFRSHIDSGGGNIHGGVLASLADTAIACALSTNFDGKMGFATSNLNIHYLRRARTGVVATATILKKGATVCVGYVEIRDEEGELVAVTTADFVLTTSRFPRDPA